MKNVRQRPKPDPTYGIKPFVVLVVVIAVAILHIVPNNHIAFGRFSCTGNRLAAKL
jgi:hypothetical protein